MAVNPEYFSFNGAGNKHSPLFANVKAYGASGDGTSDDAIAIQNALDDLSESGGIIFFPKGTYLIKSYLYFYSNQMLYFENGAKLLQGAEMNALLIAYGTTETTEYNGTHDVVIYGGIFDGGTEYTTHNTLLGFSHSRNIKVINCKFINSYGYWHNLEINSSEHVLVEGCEFEGLRKTAHNGCMLQIDSFYEEGCYLWGTGAVDNTICQHIEISRCHFYDNTASPGIGNHSNGGKNIRIHHCVFEGLTNDRGAINFYNKPDNINIDIYNNTFVGCSSGVTIPASPALSTVHDNRFIDTNTPIATSGITAYNNMVDGVLMN